MVYSLAGAPSQLKTDPLEMENVSCVLRLKAPSDEEGIE